MEGGLVFSSGFFCDWYCACSIERFESEASCFLE